MKRILLFVLLVCIKQINAQTWQWAEGVSGTGGNEGYSAATDAKGNVFATGSCGIPAICGTYTLTNGSTGHSNVFIAKYDSSGNVLWAKSAGGGGNDNGYCICTDTSGNAFMIGYLFSPTITFGTYTLTNAGAVNLFLVKYDANGNVLWAKSAGGTSNDFGNSATTDVTGNVFVTGSFQSPAITFGTYTLTNTGGVHVFITKYDANGNVLWAKSSGGTNGVGNSVSTDTIGNVFVTGRFSSPTITFGTYTLTNAGTHNNVFIAKYDANGNVLWAKCAGGAGSSTSINTGDAAYSVNTDATGNAFVAGYFSSPVISFGTYTLTNGGTNTNVFIAKYDANGNVLWAKSSGGTGSSNLGDIAYSASTDVVGNVFVSGAFNSPTMTFGTYTLTPPAGSMDKMFLVKYDANGNVLCASALASGGDDNNGVSADRFGNAYIAGDFYANPFVVGSTTLTVTGTENIFVAKYRCTEGNSGIKHYADNNTMRIYPNPNNGSFVIEPSSTTRQTMQVYDVTGKMVLSQTITGKTNIDASTLNEGVYNISLQSNEGVVNKRLVIVW